MGFYLKTRLKESLWFFSSIFAFIAGWFPTKSGKFQTHYLLCSCPFCSMGGEVSIHFFPPTSPCWRVRNSLEISDWGHSPCSSAPSQHAQSELSLGRRGVSISSLFAEVLYPCFHNTSVCEILQRFVAITK